MSTALAKNLSSIFELESALSSMEQLPIDCKHHFTRGVYAREIFIPKGTILTGKMHKHNHFNFVLSGDIEVATEDGAKRIKGPCMFESKAGTKRAGYVHEDTIWITIHATEQTDLEIIEQEEIVEDTSSYLKELRGNKLCHG